MTDHSPDHAERAREVLAAVTEAMAPAGKYVARDILSNNLSPDNERAIAAMLAYADERVAAALRGRDRVVEDLTTALHDAISRPAGVVPASAEPFYDWRRYDRGPVQGVGVEEEVCPLCEGKPMPAGMGCIAGCREGIVLTTSANVLRNVKTWLERSADAVEWEVWQDDMPVATSTSEADAQHYLMVYGQDGPATLMRVERTEIARAGRHDAKVMREEGPAAADNPATGDSR
jgi:hypothetical protein